MQTCNMDICFKLQNSSKNGTEILCSANVFDGTEVCKCKVCVGETGKQWTISSWFVKEEYQRIGIGKNALQYVLNYLYRQFGLPKQICYIWNGANQFVYNWMEKHFEPKCCCPLAVQKTQSEDDWLSHIYELDVKKVLQYFAVS